MATIRNQWIDPRELLESPAVVSLLDVTPLVVTPIVTDESLLGHLIENDQSLAAATGDPTLRPLADYLAYSTPPGAGDINVRYYGATGDGVTDDTAAVRLAVQALGQRVTVAPGSGSHSVEATRLVFPPGVYRLTGSINFQTIGNGSTGGTWTVDMTGAVILCAAAGKTMFDCLGCRWGTFIGGLLIGDETSKPAIGIQYGRINPVPPGPIADGMAFLHVKMIGRWTRSCWYNLAGESSVFESCQAYNEHGTGGSAIVIDGCNHLGAITDFTPTTMPTDVAMSCANTGFFHAYLACGPNGDPALDTYAVEMLTIVDTYIVSRGPAVRHTAISDVGAIVSRLHYDFHAELHTNNVEFVRLGTAGPMVVDGMYIADVTPMASVALIKAGAGVNNLYIYDGEIHVESTPIGSGALFSGTVGYAGSVRGNVVSLSTVGNIDIAFTAASGSLGLRGALNRIALNAVLTAPRTWTLPPIATVPAGWRFTVTDTVGGISNVNTLTIIGAGGTLISGQTSLVFSAPYDGATFISEGTKWSVESGWRNRATRTRFWSDVNNGAAITTPRALSHKERIMVGAATEYTNLARSGGPSFGWLTNANGAAWMGRDGSVVSVAEDGNVAVFGASRASDGPSGTAAIGLGAYVTLDAASPSGGWAAYFELSREHASASGQGIELDVKNCAAGVNNGNPYGNGVGPNGLWIACGPGSGAGGYGTTPTNNSGSAMVVLCNTSGGNTFRYTKGIVIQATALVGVNGTDGEAPGAGALEMGRGHSIRWYATGALLKAAITSKLDSTDVDWAVYWLGNSMIFARNGAAENVVHLTAVASAVNYFRLTNAVAGAAPQIQAVGPDANVDVTLTPQGTGNVRYGTNTAKAAEAFASYITIKDAGGTLRKLMVCA